MANVTRFSPLDEAFDNLFRGFFVGPVAMETPATSLKCKMDVAEDEKAYTVHAEIPGVKKEDIHVNVDGNQVSVTAEVKRNSEEKQGERVLRTERYYGKVSRAFTLANEIDASGAQAKYENGVLQLTLPKKSVAATKQLTVQ